jgi:hypothetical protein
MERHIGQVQDTRTTPSLPEMHNQVTAVDCHARGRGGFFVVLGRHAAEAQSLRHAHGHDRRRCVGNVGRAASIRRWVKVGNEGNASVGNLPESSGWRWSRLGVRILGTVGQTNHRWVQTGQETWAYQGFRTTAFSTTNNGSTATNPDRTTHVSRRRWRLRHGACRLCQSLYGSTNRRLPATRMLPTLLRLRVSSLFLSLPITVVYRWTTSMVPLPHSAPRTQECTHTKRHTTKS